MTEPNLQLVQVQISVQKEKVKNRTEPNLNITSKDASSERHVPIKSG